MNLVLILTAFAGDIDFARHIRPLLADRCYACHGPDAGQRQADLRLDEAKSATRQLESGHTAVVPGESKNSELVRRINSTDPDLQMPPAGSGKVLSREERQLLERWIQEGAEYPKHWSFTPPTRPDVPEVPAEYAGANPIDRFVIRRILDSGLRPSPPAGRATLARRASLDLRGIPPALAELDVFLNDESTRAWPRYIDGLLKSPHYGERMAQDWLDLARYGDTNGYHADSDRTMWLYRDYVIDSFNDNKPFDQFVMENMAGDLLPGVTDQTRVASGFNRCNTFNEEGGADPDEFYVAYAIDRANTTGQVFLGLTIGCAQCHDHKYDPISQKDYYRLFAYFNSVAGEVGAGGPSGYHNRELPPLLRVPTREQQAELDGIPGQINELDAQVQAALETWKAPDDGQWQLVNKWVTQLRGPAMPTRPELPSLVVWLDAGDLNGNGRPDSEEEFQPEAGVTVWKDRSGNGHHAEAVAAPDYVPDALGGLPAVRFNGSGHHMRTKTGGKQLAEDFTLVCVFRSVVDGNNQMLVMWGEEANGKRRSLWRMTDSQFSFNGYNRDVPGKIRVEQKPHIGVIARSAGDGEVQLFVDGEPGGVGKPELVGYENDRITLGCNNGNGEFAGAEFSEILIFDRRLSEQEHQQLGQYLGSRYNLATKYQAAPPEILRLASLPVKDRTAENSEQLSQYYGRHVDPQTSAKVRDLEEQLADLRQRERAIRDAIPSTLVMVEKKQRTPAYVLIRGDFQHRGEEVSPGIPAVFGSVPDGTPQNRLGLARWLTSPGNPLVARVAVNRIWRQMFGSGLVRTTGDFGTQGELPSHPQLLDWLAVEFIESGWDIQHIQRLILTSSTWQQSSVNRGQAEEVDPDNRLLSRAPRFRLSAETIRDVALSASGLLNPRVGGPSVKPFQPEGFYSDKIGRAWAMSSGEDRYRRGIYTYWRRTTLYPAFQIFDAPSREFCTVSRPRTNTPLQALVLMNDAGYVEAAVALARETRTSESELSARIQFAFRRVTSRNANRQELELLSQVIREQQQHFQDHPNAAAEFVGGKISPDNQADLIDLAAWSTLASVILNLDESITRE